MYFHNNINIISFNILQLTLYDGQLRTSVGVFRYDAEVTFLTTDVNFNISYELSKPNATTKQNFPAPLKIKQILSHKKEMAHALIQVLKKIIFALREISLNFLATGFPLIECFLH